ncbi:hypothetical protein K502DRAFT_146685 [Neoconidiobolus thromboides FSU 785]|nr:hypothetical protein K502DRAFT_146685 [Neoconidiobolus thromboides FSU 785]
MEPIIGSYLPSVAHFHCHYYPVACLAFNGTGNLLATASVEGHTFYIYEIIGANSQQPPFKLLYKLSRGLTDAKVIDMVFNIDSRWLATTTQHGTTHLFQINPYGGPPHHESHTSGRVMNPINSSTSNKGYTDYSKVTIYIEPSSKIQKNKRP